MTDSKRITGRTDLPNGWYVVVTTEYDPESKPTDSDCYCYSAKDIERWKRDEWKFVGLIATVHSPDDRSWGSASVWSVEDGFEADDGKVWHALEREDLIDDLISDAAYETREQLAETAETAELAQWAQITGERS